MATIGKHNQLIKIMLGGSNKHLNHVLTDEAIKSMTLIESRYPITRLPVCEHCEKLGMWNKDGFGVCRACGTITKNPITYSQYLSMGYDIDATGATAKSVFEEKKAVRTIWLPNY